MSWINPSNKCPASGISEKIRNSHSAAKDYTTSHSAYLDPPAPEKRDFRNVGDNRPWMLGRRVEPYAVVDCVPKPLFAAQVALRRLNAFMPKQELDLL